MRDLSPTLLAEQRKSSVKAYVRVRLVGIGDAPTYNFRTTDSPSRLYSILPHREEPYGGIAIIQLKNHDSYFNSINLKGYEVTIRWGLVTGEGNEYSRPASLWVLSQRDISEEGQLLTELACIDIWGLLARTEVYTGGKELKRTITWKAAEVSAATERITGGTSGAKAIIYAVYNDRIHVVQPEGLNGTFQVGETAESTSLSIVISAVDDIGSGGVAPAYDGTFSVFTIIQQMLAGFTTLTLDSDDPENNAMTYKPKYQTVLGTSVRSVIMDVLGYTKCGLRMRTDGMHMLYLDPSPDSADYEFNSDHKFLSENRERAIVVPNRIFVTNEIDGEVYVGYDEDEESYNALGKWLSRIITIPSVASNADATARAVALIARAKAEANAGDVVVPIMNCGQEVYDWLKVTDSRNNNIVVTGRVGAVERRYIAGTYQMLVRLGGLSTSADITPEGIPESNIQVGPVGPADITPKVITGANIPPGAQAYICDVRFTSVDWNTVSWASATLTLQNGTTLTINSGSKDLANDNPYYAYFIWGNHTLQWTQTYGDTIGEDRGLIGVIKRGSSSSDKAYAQNFFTDSILINRDKVMDDLVNSLKLANDAVTEAKIATDAVSGPKIQSSAITAGKIRAGAVIASKIQADAIIASKIKAGAVTAVKIDAAAVDATKIKANAVISDKIKAGAVTADKLAATLILATTIWAGSSKVKLDSSGIAVYGEFLRFYYGSTYVGYIKALSSTKLQIYCGKDIEFYSDRIYLDAEIWAEQSFLPYSTTVYLGSSSNRFRRVYGCPILSIYAEAVIDGALIMQGGGSGDLKIYSDGGWRTNT